MYCSNCGKELCDEAYVCTNCGCLLKEEPILEENKKEKANGMAIAGFVCSFLFPVLGWVFGGIGLSNAAKMNGKGKGLSIAAIVIASVNFVLSLIINVMLY